MKNRRVVYVILLTILAAAAVKAQAQEEFVSIVGRFGVMLPSTYAGYRTNTDVVMGGKKFSVASYLWNLDHDQVVITHGSSSEDFETPSQADLMLKAFRDDYVAKVVAGQITGEKKTSLNNHPGLISVIETSSGRVMLWTYVLKNRLYLISLTLNDPANVEQHVKTLGTFRFLSRKDLEPRYKPLVQELTPAGPEDSPKQRPTTDASDRALKGRVKQVITEQEPYYGSVLFGEPEIELHSVDDYDTSGNLTRQTIFAGGLPTAVRVYGSFKGERGFREMRRFPKIELAGDRKEKKPHVTPAEKPEARDYKLKYKYDEKGRLLELRIVGPKDHELETFIYSLKDRTLGHQVDSAYFLFRDIRRWNLRTKQSHVKIG